MENTVLFIYSYISWVSGLILKLLMKVVIFKNFKIKDLLQKNKMLKEKLLGR